MAARKERNYLRGAAILAAAAVIAKIIGAIFKIPLYNILGNEGTAHFNKTYNVYTLLLTLSYSGIPVALSRLISVSVETGNTRQSGKYFRVALPVFSLLGAIASIAMFVFAPQLASFVEDPLAALGIRVLSPAVFLCCVISVFEGFAQGHGDMIPTAVKQLTEVTCKLIFGLSIAWFLMRRGFSTEIASAGAITGVVIGLLISLPMLIRFKARRFPANRLEGAAKTTGETLYSIIRVSVPIALGASLMNILTLVDSKVVTMRLVEGVGMTLEAANDRYGVYSKCLALFNLTPALISPISVSVIPAISALVGTGRRLQARATMESAIKMVCLIALPAGAGLSVLATPIYGALYNSHEGSQVLMILGIAAIFACVQLLTTAVLQANGLERVPILSFLLGGAVQLVCDWILVGTPSIGIIGSPIGTLACYATITLVNLFVIVTMVPDPPRIFRTIAKPLLATALMGVAALSVYGLSQRAFADALGTGRLADMLYTAVAIFVAVIVYLVAVVGLRALTSEDLRFMPKGAQIAKLLRIRD